MTRRTNPLPQLVPLRVRRALERVDGLIWTDPESLGVAGGPTNPDPIPLEAALEQPLVPVSAGEHFGPAGGGWQQRWFHIELPRAPAAARPRYLHWRCEGEATAYIDGKPWAGLDHAHRTCLLPPDAGSLWIDHATYATGIAASKAPGIGRHGCRFDGAELTGRNERAWKVGCDLDVFLQLTAQLLRDGGHEIADDRYGHQATLDRCSPLLRLLLHDLDAACEDLDHRGLATFSAALDRLFARLPAESWQPLMAICPQTHIDLVWLWPENEAERKAVHSMATMLRLLEAYPDLVVSMSQPAMYRALERRAPSLAAEIGARIAEGRWEATGAFEVEPDTQLPCGEALARSLAIGQRKLAELRGGARNRLCWLPDVFGYAGCLPQMLRLAGVDRFFTTKLRWSAITRFPHQSFVWRGSDGSEVLAQISTIGYTGVCQVEPLVTAAREYAQHGAHDELIVAQGYGDGGGGPTEAMIERGRRFANLAGLPRARFSKAEDFFARLEPDRERLPVYQGELYLEYHRGTYTTQGEFKRLHRRLETALQIREAVRVVTGGGPIEERPWQRLSFAQFHDAIPGSSIALVYQQLSPELQALGDEQLAASRAELASAGGQGDTVIFNPLPLPRRVHLPATNVLVDLPALGGVGQGKAADVAPIRRASSRLLDNGRLVARFDESGDLMGLATDGEAHDVASAAGLVMYVDQPAKFGAWDIDHQALRRGTAVAMPGGLTVCEEGPWRAVLRGQTDLGERSKVQIEYVLEAGSRWLQIQLAIDWREDHRLLKYHLPTGYRGRFARFGAPFGSTLRPQHAGTHGEEAMWEVPASRWAAVTDDGGSGLAMVTEAKYGFSCRDGDLGLSVLRAPTDPDPDADRGVHVIRFALGAHRTHTAGHELSTAAAAEALFMPVLAFGSTDAATLPPPPFRLETLGSLVPAWVMPAAGGGFVVRLHETGGERGTATLHLGDRPGAVELVDFLEDALPAQAAVRRVKDDVYTLQYAPYQILGVRVRP